MLSLKIIYSLCSHGTKLSYGCHHRQAITTITMKLPVEWKVIGKDKTIEEKGRKKVQQMEENGKKEKSSQRLCCSDKKMQLLSLMYWFTKEGVLKKVSKIIQYFLKIRVRKIEKLLHQYLLSSKISFIRYYYIFFVHKNQVDSELW